jgi:hypothetical protein
VKNRKPGTARKMLITGIVICILQGMFFTPILCIALLPTDVPPSPPVTQKPATESENKPA